MKRLTILYSLLVMVILSLLMIQGCHKEKETDKIPPPEFYEFNIREGNGVVYLFWHFPGLRDSEFGVEVSYYVNDEKKVQRVFGMSTMTISGLTNNESYEFTFVGYDKAGNRNKGFKFTAIPNTPFVVVSPTSSDGYSIENGKVRIDLRFNRLADTTYMGHSLSLMSTVIQLSVGLSILPYSYKWLEEGMVLSILTNNTKESFCTSFPCSLYLRFHTSFIGPNYSIGICDTNGMELDADKDGFEMGEAKLIFILE